MDPVLSRKLFREKYIQEVKPKKFNKGGIATLKLAEGGEVATSGATFTENEKLGYLLAPVAAQLLQAKQRPGESALSSLFGAVGEGVSQIPAIGLKIAEIEGKKKGVTKQLKPLSESEKITYKYNPKDEVLGTYENGVLTGIAKENFKLADAKKSVLDEFQKAKIGSADAALKQLESLITQTGGGDISGVGPLAGRLPDFMVSEQGKQTRASFNQFANLTLREISGAAVTDSERENYLKQYGGGLATSSEQTFKKALYDARDLIEKGKERILASMDSRAVADLIDNGGITLSESPTVIKAAAGALRPQAVGENKVMLGDGKFLKKIGDVTLMYDPKVGYKTTEYYSRLTGAKQ
jgi:hypothetical protein